MNRGKSPTDQSLLKLVQNHDQPAKAGQCLVQMLSYYTHIALQKYSPRTGINRVSDCQALYSITGFHDINLDKIWAYMRQVIMSTNSVQVCNDVESRYYYDGLPRIQNGVLHINTYSNDHTLCSHTLDSLKSSLDSLKMKFKKKSRSLRVLFSLVAPTLG